MSKIEVNPPVAPSYLTGKLKQRFEDVSPKLAAAGIINDTNRDILAKYIVAENEYLQVSNFVQQAIAAQDADAANKWLTAQDRLTKQILSLGAELGLTPNSRRSWGLPVV